MLLDDRARFPDGDREQTWRWGIDKLSVGRRVIFGTLLLVAVVVIAVAGGRGAAQAQPTTEPESVSAIEACHPPATAEKAGGTLDFTWQMAARLDSPQVSVLLFTSGSDLLLCEAWRASDGNYGSSTTALGRFEPQLGATLTYDSGSEPAPGDAWPAQLVIGQAPHSAASIEVITADGEQHAATIANGFYLAWVSTGEIRSNVVEIDAHDSTGRLIARLADPSGLRPGSSAVPASS